MTKKNLSRKELANAIRFLSMDAVQKANSGHPGMPMGMADIAEVLWNDYLSHNPANPNWFNRDRFVLSNGHGSMLLYSIAYLTGYNLSIDEIKNFRQLGYKTAGHPEREQDIGIETTTGPLGQGIANAVGMAIAEKSLAKNFNKPELNIVDHYTYVFLGDGCLMEGISHEACSLAGTLGLGKLIVFYDDNGISIDGDVSAWFTDDTPGRFRSYGWHVVDNIDGHDSEAISEAIKQSKSEKKRPSIICCKTLIGYGSPNKQGTADTHGAPLGEDEIEAARSSLNWNYKPFEIPESIKSSWNAKQSGKTAEDDWNKTFIRYQEKYPKLASEFIRRMEGNLPIEWECEAEKVINNINSEGQDMATRKASQRALDGFAPMLGELFGGSADLTGSNNTFHVCSDFFDPIKGGGNYLNFGVREFAMVSILNGLRLHGGFIPYGGTFLVFSDYARNALRMASLIGLQNILVFTHDSIGLGEDGPTHQPIEHLASLRAMPNMSVWRPCDTIETAVAWKSAIESSDAPSSLALTRQSLNFIQRDKKQISEIKKGGYILLENSNKPEIIFISSGSEVKLALDSAKILIDEGRQVRVVSMPCLEVFDSQTKEYRESVIDPNSKILAIEAGSKDSWWKYVSGNGNVIGIDSYGKSAPANDLFELFGFSVASITKQARNLID
ncbi:MAG: transketolase [Pseudomonadota bacterium]|nr:transketolase [Gammaproteobacteria bacterium]MEE2683795.1 transketolase [Pseudomonadota bacterium]|tara:strand:- start:400 stop:2406 length:2007 start_codon:yes stop_codon:yes gene_type:complete